MTACMRAGAVPTHICVFTQTVPRHRGRPLLSSASDPGASRSDCSLPSCLKFQAVHRVGCTTFVVQCRARKKHLP